MELLAFILPRSGASRGLACAEDSSGLIVTHAQLCARVLSVLHGRDLRNDASAGGRRPVIPSHVVPGVPSGSHPNAGIWVAEWLQRGFRKVSRRARGPRFPCKSTVDRRGVEPLTSAVAPRRRPVNAPTPRSAGQRRSQPEHTWRRRSQTEAGRPQPARAQVTPAGRVRLRGSSGSRPPSCRRPTRDRCPRPSGTRPSPARAATPP